MDLRKDLELLDVQVSDRSEARHSDAQRAGMCPGIFEELLRGSPSRIRPHDEDVVLCHEFGDRHIGVRTAVRQVDPMRLHGESGHSAQSERVSVRRRCQGICNGACARGLRSVHHNDRLVQVFLRSLGKGAGELVTCTADTVRDKERDRLLRV